MLQLINVCKSYTTADFTQTALDHVSVAFRDNEFVAVLGPSGSGKTTMLNIIGGLDHYDGGNLLIDGVSTSEYKDRDWDAYRNNRIGFVFQAYNLIPHQIILENVELALTLSGVSRAERRQRAVEALGRVGLAEHVNKKPSQLSGGQMQRVAIARALINDPEILLADEPTGALDSKTSVQIMDLLTEIADDRLVIMVTHNPELAQRYATRIVTLADGVIRDDTRPFDPAAESAPLRAAKQARRTSMSFLTALSLSFKNLLTKKGRTLMTAFAGSIGIIGIAAILSLANGVNSYIANVEEETLSEYPLQIQDQGFDMTSMMGLGSGAEGSSVEKSQDDASDGDSDKPVHESKMIASTFDSIGSNDLASLKEFFDSGESGVEPYVSSIEYGYNVTPQIFGSDTSGGVHQVNPDKSFSSIGLGSSTASNGIMSSMMSTNIFYKLPDNMGMVEGQYDVMAGHWPENYDEVVLVLTPGGSVSDFMLYSMGLRDHAELESMVRAFANEEAVNAPSDSLSFSYDDLMGVRFKLVNAADFYRRDDEYGVWKDKSGDDAYMRNLVDNGETLKIAGVVKPKEGAKITSLQTGLYYPSSLVNHLIDQAGKIQIVQDQKANPATNVITGKSFADEESDQKSGNGFDMSSLFTIDGQKLQSAFTFDQSALTAGLQGADLGASMDLSGINLDLSSLPAFDASSISIDPSAIDVSKLSLDFSGLDISFDGVQPTIKTDVLTAGVMGVVQGYPAWLAAHPEYAGSVDTAVAAYLADPATQAAMQQVIADSIDFSGMSSQIEQQLRDQLSQQIGQQLQQQLLPALTQVISSQLQTQLGAAMQTYMQSAMAQVMTQFASAMQQQVSAAMNSYMTRLADNMSSAMGIDQSAFADAFQMNMDENELAELMASLMSTEQSSYDNNMKKLGWADYAKPASIDIYPKDFPSKQSVIDILDAYNDRMEANGEEGKVVSYTDIVGALMSSVTTIVNMISYVLVAFVAISLVVSSIMIGVITYISVLERKKEIGILRSIGASKGDISRVFNAETVIVGFTAGVIGIGLTALACIPANAIVYSLFDVRSVAILPWQAAVVLVGISVLLTFLAGLIPSSAASRKDPVEALRSE
ncbi:ABC transporter ATP-binding protein/permease [uncultured Senegalimassilia sp.]|uniref:ABC transporter ATP-binding protein/permease n=1 Tax=uncultured Senegalimassilia sp. TaxID=1714350 RepID=UPI0025CF3C4D|nr:ABC transporter ATP-binding protein/permease [uncultured Senegalimassilia sp.]